MSTGWIVEPQKAASVKHKYYGSGIYAVHPLSCALKSCDSNRDSNPQSSVSSPSPHPCCRRAPVCLQSTYSPFPAAGGLQNAFTLPSLLQESPSPPTSSPSPFSTAGEPPVCLQVTSLASLHQGSILSYILSMAPSAARNLQQTPHYLQLPPHCHPAIQLQGQLSIYPPSKMLCWRHTVKSEIIPCM